MPAATLILVALVLGVIVGYMIQALVPAAAAGSGTAGQSLDLPMSPQLETLIRAMAVKPE